MHKPFVITKELDKSSPLLYQMLVATKLSLSGSCSSGLRARRSALRAGTEVQRYTVKLMNASIYNVDIAFHMLNNKEYQVAEVCGV